MSTSQATDFKDYIFWGKNPKSSDHNFTLSIADKNALRHCILKAYPDMQFRTMNGLGAVPSSCKIKAKEQMVNCLTEALYNYFAHGINKTFDDWHKEVCDKISQTFKAHTGMDLPFGKAQKLVNISFKYAFCLNDADQYLSKFQRCHMALDSIVLKWYAQSKIGTIIVSNWSSIEYSDYICVQNDIRKYCEEQKTFPLVKEFDVWLENMDQ